MRDAVFGAGGSGAGLGVRPAFRFRLRAISAGSDLGMNPCDVVYRPLTGVPTNRKTTPATESARRLLATSQFQERSQAKQKRHQILLFLRRQAQLQHQVEELDR